MEKSLFLLRDWFPIGVAVLVFFGIGLLLARTLWGPYARRLAAALEQNMDFVGRWSALAADLRDRWKDDRKLWETYSEHWKRQIAQKVQTNQNLIEEVQRLRTDHSAAVMKKGLEAAESKIQTYAMRVEALEQEIARGRDELATARSAVADFRLEYNRKVNLLHTLEAEFDEINRGKANGKELAGLEAETQQLIALQKQRSREMFNLRRTFDEKLKESSPPSTRSPSGSSSEESQSRIEASPGEQSRPDRVSEARIEEQAEMISFLNARIEEMEAALSERYNEVNQMRLQLASSDSVGVEPPGSKRKSQPIEEFPGRQADENGTGSKIVTDRVRQMETNRLSASLSESANPQTGEADHNLVLYFDERTERLDSSALSKIDAASRAVRELGLPFRVVIEGFAHSEGSSDFIESLSARRAETVRERVIGNGVDQSRIAVHARGKDTQLPGDEEESWKARRVELSFLLETVPDAV